MPVTERNAAIVTSSICGGRTRGYWPAIRAAMSLTPGDGPYRCGRSTRAASARIHAERRAGACAASTASTTLLSSACLVSLLFVPLLPLLPILLSLILPLGSCILILLAHPLDQCTSERARVNQDHLEVNVAVMAAVAKGYDLDYAWRALGEAYQGTAAAAWSCRDLK